MALPEPTSLQDFLRPLHLDVQKCHALAGSLQRAYEKLAKESEDQFLPTPVTESILRPQKDVTGKYLAIDIGGTNLRVGFIELCTNSPTSSDGNTFSHLTDSTQDLNHPRVIAHLEKSWPIGEQLKNNRPEDLFNWIGGCIRQVVQDGCDAWPGELPEELPLGVTFSFPMVQHTLSTATLMAMGKDFALSSDLDLGIHLLRGYNSSRPATLPDIKIVAIANDTVATLASFFYQLRAVSQRKPAMGLIVGTGTNATIPLALKKLHASKWPRDRVTNGDEKIAVNTEWTIKGAAPPLHEHGLVTRWDAKLDAEGLAPGFQPFEYMTAGRYLGELGRIIITDYFTNEIKIRESTLPAKLVDRYGLKTTFLGKVSSDFNKAAQQLAEELPPPRAKAAQAVSDDQYAFAWTTDTASVVYQVAKTIQTRASAMVAAAILGLLSAADELTLPLAVGNVDQAICKPLKDTADLDANDVETLLVGYTGGCIVHFQDYLKDCQDFLDAVIDSSIISGAAKGEEGRKRVRVVLEACHDGGILGAGILAGIVEDLERARNT